MKLKPLSEEVDHPDRQAVHATITIMRVAGMRSLPIYDPLNRDNGELSTKSKGDSLGNSIVATVDINAGSESFFFRGKISSDIFSR
jgi:hypothetical protein